MKTYNAVILIFSVFFACLFSITIVAKTVAKRDPFAKPSFIKTPEPLLSCDQPKFSMQFRDIPVKALLSLLSACKKMNMVVSAGVEGRLSINLYHVSWQQALDTVLSMQQLRQQRRNGVLFISPALKLAKPPSTKQATVLATRFIQINYAKASNLVKAVQQNGLLSPQGHISADQRSNRLWIRDFRRKIHNITQFVKAVDIPVPHVLIRAHIISVDRHYARELGLQWGTVSHKAGQAGKLSLPRLAGAALTPGRYQFALATLPDNRSLAVELNALENQGHGKVLASPRLIASNHQTATIETGEEVPYQEKTSSGATSVTFKKAVLRLQVTPDILANKMVALQISVNQDKLGALAVNGVPTIHTQRLQTQVLIHNGETIVLGGIFEKTYHQQVHKVPILGSIPLLGRLFRSKERKEEQKELLIFITPKVL